MMVIPLTGKPHQLFSQFIPGTKMVMKMLITSKYALTHDCMETSVPVLTLYLRLSKH